MKIKTTSGVFIGAMLFLSLFLSVFSTRPPVVLAEETSVSPSDSLQNVTTTTAVVNAAANEVVADPVFKVIDELRDEADLGNGVKKMRVYFEPRQIFVDKGEKKVRPDGWNKFNEDLISKIRAPRTSGYNFSVPLAGDKKIDITSGSFEIKNSVSQTKIFNPSRAVFRQYQNEDNHTVSEFKNVFKDIDINFVDKVRSRTKQIIINKKSDKINNDSEIIFWESYKVPKDSTILVGETKYTNITSTYSPTAIVLENKETLLIGSSIIYDSKVDDDSYRDMSQAPVEQIISYDEKNLTLKIGLKVRGDYLLNKDRIYPVIIDPTYYICTTGGCTDFYLQWLTGKSSETNSYLYMGYDYASGVAPCAPAGHASRHTVLKFNVDSIPDGSTVTSAKLYLRGDNAIGCGEYNSTIPLEPKKIGTSWSYSNITYDGIRSSLVTGGTSKLMDINTCKDKWCDWSLYNSMVQTWVDNGNNNNGFLIEPAGSFSSGTTPPSQWTLMQRLFRFFSSDYSSAYAPYLEVIYTDPPKPDLTDNNSTFSPASVQIGQQVAVTFNVKNITATAVNQPSVLKYYINPIGSCSSKTTYLGSITVPTMGAYGTYSNSVYYTPTNSGTYCIQFDIDANNSVSESNESNNGWYISTLTVTAPIDPLEPNDTYSQAYNIGSNTSYTNNNLILTSDDKDWFKFAYNSKTYYFKVRGYSASTAGNYGISFSRSGSTVTMQTTKVDNDVDTYLEWYGSNPTGSYIGDDDSGSPSPFSKLVVNITPTDYDFSPLNLSITNTGVHYSGNNDTVSISGQIKNTGSVSASGISYQLNLVSGAQKYTLSGLSPSSLSVSSGETKSVTLTGTIPGGMPYYDNYQVEVILDSDSSFTEIDETNNTTLTSNTVPVQQWSTGGGGGGGAALVDQIPAVASIPIGLKLGGAILVASKDFPKNFSTQADKQSTIKPANETADPVNSRNGAFEFEQTDFVLSGRGFPIKISRVYNSKAAERNERFGAGWTSSNHMYYFQDPTTKEVQIYLGGTLVSYFTTPDNGATYVADKGNFNTLYNEGDYLVYKTIDGIKYKFALKLIDNIGMIDSVVDTNSNITQFAYLLKNGVKLLSSITDPSGRAVQFVYPTSDTDTGWDKVKEIRESLSGISKLIASYTYDANNNLTQVYRENFFQSEPTVSLDSYYTYDANSLLLTYTDTRGTVLYNEYDSSGRAIKQYEKNPNLGSDDKRLIYEISYQDSADPTVPDSAHCTATKNYRDAGNYYSEKVCFNSDELKIYNERGADIERWFYDAAGMVSAYIDGNNNITNFEFDAKRRVVKETLPDTDWRTINTFEYENTFNRLIKKTETVSTVAAPSVPVEIKTSNFTYDSSGNLITAADALENAEKWEYNANGTIKKYINKLYQAINYTYEATGNYPASESTVVIQADNTTQIIAKNYTYDVYGHRTSYTDPRNLIYNYQYDYHGNLRQETNPDGNSKYYTYDKEDHKISETDELGRVTNYTFDKDINASLLKIEKLGAGGPIVYERQYDWVGNLVKEINPLSMSTNFGYDSTNRVSSKTDPIKTINYEYYDNGKLKKETNTGGARADYFYDARGNNIEVRRYYDASNYIVNKFEYDGFNRKVKEIDGKNSTTTYNYDLMDMVSQIDDALNNHTKYFYDANGNKTGEVTPLAFANADLKNSFGHSNTYVYDGVNRAIKKINAGDKYTLYVYDANGNLVSSVDRQNSDGTQNSHATNYQYDSLNHQINVTDALNGFSSSTYDAVGSVIGKKDQMNRIWNYTYDAFNRLTDEYDPANNNTHYTYDKAGNKLTVTDSQSKTTQFQYDSLSRLIKATDPLGNYEEYGYDLLNNKTSAKDKNGNSAVYVYDKLNRLTSETNPQSTVINYTYDANSNRLTENIAGKITSYEYDELNRPKKRVEPGNKIFTFGYDAGGNKTSEVNANGQTITYVYDKLDRLTKKTLPEGEVNYGYDQWNNLTSLGDLSGTTNYTYDLLNRNNSEAKTISGLAGNFNVAREYFADSQLKSITDAANKKINYNYNNRGLLDSVAYSAGNLAVYTYTSFGKPQTVTYGNGVVTTYTYDELQRPKSVETKSGVYTLFKQEYAYDKDSNRTKMIEYKLIDGKSVSSTINYAYDSLNQITGADYAHLPAKQDLSYSYDAWGNRTSYKTAFGVSAYTYTAGTNEIFGLSLNNRLNIAYTTDGNGNISKEVYSLLGKNTKTVNYNWNSENKLNSIIYQIPNQTNNVLAFVYDDFGNRVRKTINNEQLTTTYYVNNGLTVLNEVNAAGTVTKTIVNGLNQIAEIDKDNNILYVNQDVLGSAVLMTASTGAIVHQYTYDPFGNIASELGQEDKDTKYLYTGQEFDPESELYYYNARYYNPVLGRFLSKDPIIHRSDGVLGFNEYIYVKNNPLKYVDPSGEDKEKSVWNKVVNNDYVQGTAGLVVGVVNGLWSTVETVGNMVVDPIDTVVGMGQSIKNTAVGTYELSKDFYNAPSKTWNEMTTGLGITYDEFINQSPYEMNKDIGFGIEKLAEAVVFSKGVGAVTKTAEVVPIGLTKCQFCAMSSMVKDSVGSLSDDIVIQGSRVKGPITATSDLDIGIRVGSQKFEQTASNIFTQEKYGVEYGTKLENTLDKGIIHSGPAGLNPLQNLVQKYLGIETDISIIKKGGPFDQGPFLPIK